jgi:hypothetical protein
LSTIRSNSTGSLRTHALLDTSRKASPFSSATAVKLLPILPSNAAMGKSAQLSSGHVLKCSLRDSLVRFAADSGDYADMPSTPGWVPGAAIRPVFAAARGEIV